MKIKLVIFLLSLCAYGTCSSIAHANELVIDNDMSPINLLDWLLPAAGMIEDEDSYKTNSVKLVNQESLTTVWRLSTELLNPVSFEIYKLEKENQELVLGSNYPSSPQKTRASQGRRLYSAPLVIEPGGSLEITARINPRDSDSLFPVTLMTESSFDTESDYISYLHGGYFGAAFVFIAFFCTFSFFLSSRPARFYAVYFVFLTSLAAHSYGYTDSLLPTAMQWLHFPLIRLLQIGVMLTYIAFALSFVAAKERYPRFFRFACGYIFLTIILLFVEFFTYHRLFPLVVDAMALGFLFFGISTAYIALRDRINGAVFFACGFAVLLLNGVVNYIASYVEFAHYNNSVDTTTLVLQLTDALIFAAAIVSQTYALKRERDDSLKAQLLTAIENQKISDELLQAQRDRAVATQLAERHRAKLASTSHDLSQPMSSLRLAIRESDDVSSDVQEKLTAGLDYLVAVLGDANEQAAPDSALSSLSSEDMQVKNKFEEENEAVPLQIIFENIQRMFSTEATEKGLELRIKNTTLVASASAVVLIRMLSNLVANAIKYSSSGTILIGARVRGQKLALQVWDTGDGLDEVSLQQVTQPYVRGKNVQEIDGLGLGLSIVHEMASANDYSILARSVPGSGSVFTIKGVHRAYN